MTLPPTIVQGIDLVEISRVAELLERHGRRFIDRVYTASEQEVAERSGRRRAERYAARFAVKEAAAKALGTGIAGGLHWTDIETVVDVGGRPSLRLSGGAEARARELGLTTWTVSITHAAGLAVAAVIGCSPGP